MWLFQCRHACWWCKCVKKSSLNVTVSLDLKRPETMLGNNIDTMFTQCCLNIVSMLVVNVGHQSCYNVHKILPKYYLNVGVRHCHNIPQHCLNVFLMLVNISQWCHDIVVTLGFWSKYNISILVPNSGDQHWYSIHTTLPERCLNVGLQCWEATLPQRWHNIAWIFSQMLANVGIYLFLSCLALQAK